MGVLALNTRLLSCLHAALHRYAPLAGNHSAGLWRGRSLDADMLFGIVSLGLFTLEGGNGQGPARA